MPNSPKMAYKRPTPEERRQYVRHANGLLGIAARGVWQMTKLLARIAVRIPGWFVKANKRPKQKVHSDVTNNIGRSTS